MLILSIDFDLLLMQWKILLIEDSVNSSPELQFNHYW